MDEVRAKLSVEQGVLSKWRKPLLLASWNVHTLSLISVPPT